VGYWAFFSAAGTVTLPVVGPQTQTVTLPPSQWVMIGNPGSAVARLSGADRVLTYDPTSGTYTQVTSLQPGQGAWAISYLGGAVTITNASSASN